MNFLQLGFFISLGILGISGYCPERFLTNSGNNYLLMDAFKDFEMEFYSDFKYQAFLKKNRMVHYFEIEFYNDNNKILFKYKKTRFLTRLYNLTKDCRFSVKSNPNSNKDICEYDPAPWDTKNKFCTLIVGSYFYNYDTRVSFNHTRIQIRFNKYNPKYHGRINFDLNEKNLKFNIDIDPIKDHSRNNFIDRIREIKSYNALIITISLTGVFIIILTFLILFFRLEYILNLFRSFDFFYKY